MNGLRSSTRTTLQAFGLLSLVRKKRRQLRGWIKLARRADIRDSRREDALQFEQVKRDYGSVLRVNLKSVNDQPRKALVLSRSFTPIELQLWLVKALEMAGFTPVVLTISERKPLKKYFHLAGVKEVLAWHELLESLSSENEAAALFKQVRSLSDLLNIEHRGVRVGRIAAATALRQLRLGNFDLSSTEIRKTLERCLAHSIASTLAAGDLIQAVKPQLALSTEVEYTPAGELIDTLITQGIDVIKYRESHKSNSLLMKRFNVANRDNNVASLSNESWQAIKTVEWSAARRNELQRELHDGYKSGDWFAVSATQFDKQFLDRRVLEKELQLEPSKKTAVIFTHIPWDASLRLGHDLFDTYEEWLVETVKAACTNERVNWVVKVHPANVGKQLKEGFAGEPTEVSALKRAIGKLPAHVRLLSADSSISTYSLFSVMDFCVTVRGTVGIEAASLGIPVLTAGMGRYDRRGFTIDPDSRQDYLSRIRQIQDQPKLSSEQRELAERFAYGLFIMRPLKLKSVTQEFARDYGIENRFARTQLQINAAADWSNADDLRAMTEWIKLSSNPDFLTPLTSATSPTINEFAEVIN